MRRSRKRIGWADAMKTAALYIFWHNPVIGKDNEMNPTLTQAKFSCNGHISLIKVDTHETTIFDDRIYRCHLISRIPLYLTKDGLRHMSKVAKIPPREAGQIFQENTVPPDQRNRLTIHYANHLTVALRPGFLLEVGIVPFSPYRLMLTI
jgi:hypothetical protein